MALSKDVRNAKWVVQLKDGGLELTAATALVEHDPRTLQLFDEDGIFVAGFNLDQVVSWRKKQA